MSTGNLFRLSAVAVILSAAVWVVVRSGERSSPEPYETPRGEVDRDPAVVGRAPALEASREPIADEDAGREPAAGLPEARESDERAPLPSIDPGAMGIEELQITLAATKVALDMKEGPAMEAREESGIYAESYFVEGSVPMSRYANAEVPTKVVTRRVEGTDLSEVNVVSLPRDEYPEICRLYDRYVALQQELRARQAAARKEAR